jgi:hypothetical protein
MFDINFLLLLIVIIFSSTGYILKTMSNVDSTDLKKKYNPTLFWSGIVCMSIAVICVIIYLIITGIDLTRPTITHTRTKGVQQINSGIPLF